MNNNSPLDTLPKNEWDALIIHILKPFYHLCRKDVLVDPEDLQQEAWIALLCACERYDPTRAKFVTFAYHYIRGRVMRYILQKTNNKLNQLSEDAIFLNEKSFVENNVESNDFMKTMLGTVENEPFNDLLIEHFVKNKSYRTIGKEQGLSHEIIRKRLNTLVSLIEMRLQNDNS